MRDHSLTNESVYDRERMERQLHELAKANGLSRRRFLQILAGGAGLAALSDMPFGASRAWANHVAVVKPTPDESFIIFPTNREMRWEAMKNQGYYTPNAKFFVRNHTRTPHVDVSTWRLRIDGSGVSNPIDLTYGDLLSMEQVTETKFIECAGNGRRFYGEVLGQPAAGTPWRLGAIGVAEWTGVRLSEVLARAGVKSTAVDVMPEGLDNEVISGGVNVGHVRRPIPIEKALEDDTLIVYAMNSEPLPEDHGFPVRMLVSGWVGLANIKWVGRIQVAETPLYSDWNTNTYILVGDAYPDRPAVSTQGVKSAFELAWGATLPAGNQVLTGRSWSGIHKIAKVEVSLDDGASWRLATLFDKNIPKAWARWSIDWNPAPGSYKLLARATDKKGRVQPSTIPFNQQGYLYTAVVRHPVTLV